MQDSILRPIDCKPILNLTDRAMGVESSQFKTTGINK